MRALAVAVIATIAVTGAGTVDAEPRSIHESIGIDTLGSADTSTLSKPIRINVRDCSEAVAGANLPNAILPGCKLAGAYLFGANLYAANLTSTNLNFANLAFANLAFTNLTQAGLSGANLAFANLTGADLSGANLGGAALYGVTGWDSVKGKGSIVGLDAAVNVPD